MANIGQISVKVEDASGNVQGDGPVFVESASVAAKLDAAGNFSVTAPLSDERARDLLTNERRVTIYVDGDELGAGIIRKVEAKRTENGFDLVASGPDLLNELQRVSTLRGRVFDDTALNSAVSTLVGLVSGWSASGTVTDKVHLRFDGQSVAKALGAVTKARGIHYRKGTGKTVEFGAFGADSGLRVVEAATEGVLDNDKALLIDNVRVIEDTSEVVNWILPLGGGGGGEAALTLGPAFDAGTRTTGLGFPYDIQTITGPRGNTLYYLTDAGSVTTYGTIQQVATYSQVRPLSNNDTDLLRGSQALYDVCAADLQRRSQKLTTLAVSVVPSRTVDTSVLRPGSKVNVRYKGVVEKDNGTYTYLDVNDDYWVMETRRTVGLSGVRLTLTVASVDRVEMDAAETLIGAIEDIQVNNVSVAQYFDTYRFPYYELVDSSNDATLPLEITSETRTVSRVLLRLKTRPFRATASGAASGGGATSSAGGGATSSGGGNHNHRVLALTSLSGFPATTSRPYLGRQSDGGANLFVRLETNINADFWTESSSGSHTHTVPAHTHTVPNHTHTLNYGINEDTQFPGGVTISINGVDRTSALGGPWGTTSAAINEELDITQYITGAATLRQEHQIVIGCGSGQGIVLGQVAVQQTVASVDAGI